MGKKYQVRVRFDDFRYYYGTVNSVEERDRKTEEILNRLDMESREHIVGSQYEILRLNFKINGIRFKVLATESYGPRTLDTIDTIKNLENGKKKEVKREVLYKLTRNEKK